MEVTFKKSNHHVLELSEEQLQALFDYFNSCYSESNREKRYYEGVVMGFYKSGAIEIIPDLSCTKETGYCNMSDKMVELVKEREHNRFIIHHFHSHPRGLPFPSVNDPYNDYESLGIFSLRSPEYVDFRTFKQLGCCSYPPSLGIVKSGEKMSTLVRLDKNERKIGFLPLEDEVKIEIPDESFLCIDS